VRLRDLAEHLGLSATTVSLVLNNSPVAKTLSEATRQRVLKAAAELNYKANYFARALNQKRNYLIGILVPDFGEGYNASFITAIEAELIAKGYHYFVSSHHWDEQLIEDRLSGFIARGAEGLILVNTPVSTVPNIPTVVIGSQELSNPCTRIALDNDGGVRLALDYLYGLGHRQFAHLKGHVGSVDAEPRFRAFVSGCRDLGVKPDLRAIVQLERIQDGLDPIAEGIAAMQKLLKSGVEFTALLAFNDMSAVGAMRELLHSGISVPERVSVVGFDNVQASQIVAPPLTTIAQPIQSMAATATTELLATIETGAAVERRIVVAPELLIRGSSAPVYHSAAQSSSR
jgi:DNA-binding LacI/PurR family transcriptional regulator